MMRCQHFTCHQCPDPINAELAELRRERDELREAREHERRAAELLREVFELRVDTDMSGKPKRFYVVHAGSSQRALEWLRADAARKAGDRDDAEK